MSGSRYLVSYDKGGFSTCCQAVTVANAGESFRFAVKGSGLTNGVSGFDFRNKPALPHHCADGKRQIVGAGGGGAQRKEAERTLVKRSPFRFRMELSPMNKPMLFLLLLGLC